MRQGIQRALCAGLFFLCFSSSAFAADPAINADSFQTETTTQASAGTAVPAAISKIQQFRDRVNGLTTQALSLIGVHYKFGGSTPETGLDCSGLVGYLYRTTVGLSLPRTATELAHIGTQVSMRDLQPGDLVFFSTLKRKFSHVGIYLGGNKFIHAPRRGENVRIEDMGQDYWQAHFTGVRRVIDEDTIDLDS